MKRLRMVLSILNLCVFQLSDAHVLRPVFVSNYAWRKSKSGMAASDDGQAQDERIWKNDRSPLRLRSYAIASRSEDERAEHSISSNERKNPFSNIRTKKVAAKAKTEQSMKFMGIMHRGAKIVALIGYKGETYTVGVGESVGDATIKKVSDQGILIQKKGKSLWIKMPVE